MLGDLVRNTRGQWITRPPTRCPNWHCAGIIVHDEIDPN
jgi:hypothetical protein